MLSFPKTLSSVTTNEFGTENATSPACFKTEKKTLTSQNRNSSKTRHKKSNRNGDLKVFAGGNEMYRAELIVM
jgi:hypothetical protein